MSNGPREHSAAADVLETDIPKRLDALPWRRFHWLVVGALGITWVLDGLEVGAFGEGVGDPQQADPEVSLGEGGG